MLTVGMGAVVLALAVLAVLAWAGFLFASSRVRRRREAPPPNLSPFMTDDELETKRLNSVLASALIATAVLAVVLPVYYLNEANRQEASAEEFDHIAVERGEHWYEEFQCGDCHGPAGGGGGADFIEARSGLSTSWAAPSINDVLYRYDPDEVRYWLVYGRAGSPMPAWGTEGGGPMNIQQIDELIAYLDEFSVGQAEAVGQVDSRVERELSRLENAEATITEQVDRQRAEIAALEVAPSLYATIESAPDDVNDILAGPSTCTEVSAELVGLPCDRANLDSDRDGLSDAAELALGELIAAVLDVAPPSDARLVVEQLVFDPADAFSTDSGGTPIPDLEQAETLITEVDTITRDLRLAAENQERLLATATDGLAFLEDALEEERYAFDWNALAATFEGDVAAARRAVGLYNAYCARCHTAGYSAGIAFTQEAGSGAFGPSLQGGRSITQFPDAADHLDFIINGSENGKQYGVNGVGRGWMPGFGTVLSQEDLVLIVRLERAWE